MAFAQTGNGAANFITEKDLIRQIASNYTKEALIVTKQRATDEDIDVGETEQKLKSTNAGEGKKLMADNVQRINKVWQAFIKFVKNQVVVNGRVVDTTLIGLFFNDSNRQISFMPSPDFLDAGKFKLQRGVKSYIDSYGDQEETEETRKSYEDRYR